MAITTKKLEQLEYLVAEGNGVPHCFTTRLGGVSTGTLESLNIGMHRGDTEKNVAENYGILGKTIGFDPKNLVLTWQIHTDVVRRVTKADHAGFDHRGYPNATVSSQMIPAQPWWYSPPTALPFCFTIP